MLGNIEILEIAGISGIVGIAGIMESWNRWNRWMGQFCDIFFMGGSMSMISCGGVSRDKVNTLLYLKAISKNRNASYCCGGPAACALVGA